MSYETNSPSLKPVPKVQAVAVSGSTVTLILVVLALAGVDATPDDVVNVSTAGLAVITAVTTFVNTVAGYLKRP